MLSYAEVFGIRTLQFYFSELYNCSILSVSLRHDRRHLAVRPPKAIRHYPSATRMPQTRPPSLSPLDMMS